jgi:histidinol-phosphate aminotransferase
MTVATAAGPRARVDPLTAYTRPPVPPGMLKLDANEGAYPPDDLASAVATEGPELLRRYPTITALEEAFAAYVGVDEARVIATAGAGDALDRVCRAYLTPGRTVVLPHPSFEMLDRYVRVAWGELCAVPWLNPDFPRAAFIEQVRAGPAIVFLVSPNNPTGAAITADDLRAVARAAPGALVVLDHAYVEYADDDLTAVGLAEPNVLVVRTMSKAWGLAGCRVGFALGPPAVLGALRAAGPSYPLAAPSVVIAMEQLTRGDAAVARHVDRIHSERTDLTAELQSLGLQPFVSQANFVLVDCGRPAAPLRAAFDAAGIRVRDFPDRDGLDQCLRITLPGFQSGFDTLVTAVRTVLGAGNSEESS